MLVFPGRLGAAGTGAGGRVKKFLLRVGGSAILLGFLAWKSRSSWDKVADSFRDMRIELWIGAVLLYMLTQVVSAFRWQILARPLGLLRSVGQLTAYYFIGMFWNLVLPTSVGGDVFRALYLDNRSGHRLLAFLSVFADRASGLLVLLAMACVTAAIYGGGLPPWVHWFVWGSAAFTALSVILLHVFADAISTAARASKTEAGRIAKILIRLAQLVEHGRRYLRMPRLIVETTLLSLLVQAGNVVLVWMVGLGIGAKVPFGYYWIAVPMITLLTLLPVSLNGMGIREWGMVLFLRPLGIDEGTAISLAFLWFLVYTASGLSGGLVYLFGNFKRPEVKDDHDPFGDHSHQGRAGQPQTIARAPTASA
jgi:glycosyltransferase 2 family protein